MGNQASCCGKEDSALDGLATTGFAELQQDEAAPVDQDAGIKVSRRASSVEPLQTYEVTLDKSSGLKLGLDVDYMAERAVLPVLAVTGGLAQQWNSSHHARAQIARDDIIVEANGCRGNVTLMLDACKANTQQLKLVLARNVTYDRLVADLEHLVKTAQCGPAFIRLSWMDSGGLSDTTKGCSSAALRFVNHSKGSCAETAQNLLVPLAEKYVEIGFISHADLWALAANVAIRLMGGPDVPARFGRADAASAADAPEADGALLGGPAGAARIRGVLGAVGLGDRGLVALACAPVARGGPWTGSASRFDRAPLAAVLRDGEGAAASALIPEACAAVAADPALRAHAQEYAADQDAFFGEFAKAWIEVQRRGCWDELRDVL